MVKTRHLFKDVHLRTQLLVMFGAHDLATEACVVGKQVVCMLLECFVVGDCIHPVGISVNSVFLRRSENSD